MRTTLIYTHVCMAILITACATEKSQLTESGKFSIVKAEQEKSVMLKNTCRPVAAFIGITDNEAVVAAVKYNADTVQLFHTYMASDGIFSKKKVRDLRFWSCTAIIASGKKTTIKSKRLRARIATLKFINETTSQAQDYDWLAQTLPEAIEAALEKKFVFEKADKNSSQSVFDSMGSGKLTDTHTLSSFCAKADVDMAIYGRYSFNEKTQKITVQTEIYHADKSAVIGKLAMESAVDNEIFSNVNSLTERAVKTVFANELKR